MSVHIVTEGEYSDYHIVAVYMDEALAKRHVEIDPECSIETYDVTETEPHGFVTHHMSEHLLLDGTTMTGADYGHPRVQDRPTPVTVRVSPGEFMLPPFKPSWGPGGGIVRTVVGEGTDRPRLERAMQDKMAQLKAELVDALALHDAAVEQETPRT